MRWRSGRRSQNIEDRRGSSPRSFPGRVGRPLKLGGGTLILILLGTVLLGGDPQTVLMLLGGMGSGSSGIDPSPRPRMSTNRNQESASSPKDDQAADFVSVVLADTEDVWKSVFSKKGQNYSTPKLVLFSDAVSSACGFASAASGPFYCPADRKIYLDLSFFRELKRLGGAGDFAAAYVIAHEIGHHVQTLLGTSAQVRNAQKGVSKKASNALQVRMELQADCYAGIWAHHANRQRKVLEPGDIEEGLSAAAAVGDDHIQRSAGRRVHPESFTHGSSEQRQKWFLGGYRSGQLPVCNTFG